MYTTNLMAIQDNGGKLIMMDGTIWIIDPKDIENTNSWEPPCNIKIQEASATREYDFVIVNLDLNASVSAKRRR